MAYLTFEASRSRASARRRLRTGSSNRPSNESAHELLEEEVCESGHRVRCDMERDMKWCRFEGEEAPRGGGG